MRTILITGVNSNMGKHVAKELSKDYKIIGMGRTNPNIKKIRFIKFDLRRSIPKTKVDVVIHLASLTRICETNPELAYEVNVDGTRKLIKSVGNAKFIYISTGSVYGFSNKILSEEDIPKPHNVYANTKYNAELLLKNHKNYCILRLFAPYGLPMKEKSAINRTAYNINKIIKINPIHIFDFVRLLKIIIEKDNLEKVYNVAGEEVVGTKNKNSKDMIADISRLKTIGFKQKIYLKEGLKEVLKWK